VSSVPIVPGIAQSAPAFDVPPGACDCHVHVFGPAIRFEFAAARPYTPGPALAEDLLALQQALRLQRAVVVQPTAYGVDNRCLIDALQRLNGPGARGARGVAVADASTGKDELRAMEHAGVRGLRVNLVSGNAPVALASDRLRAAAESAARLGWHVQTYAPLSLIAGLHEVIGKLPVSLVVDHFGRPRARDGMAQPGFDALLELVRSGKVYVKLSAPYRISDRPGYADAEPLARALIAANPERMLWGTDWPHIEESKPGAAPRALAQIVPFRQEDNGAALDRLARWASTRETLRRILVDNPARLYGF
jgi:predicted TIM-barrel fold metal-dependent hydrolase